MIGCSKNTSSLNIPKTFPKTYNLKLIMKNYQMKLKIKDVLQNWLVICKSTKLKSEKNETLFPTEVD